MSSLKIPNGDDYPDAAGKHLADAKALFTADRYDGAAYLSGYVAECSLKSLLQVETGKASRIHRLLSLADQVSEACLAAGASTSKYVVASIRNLPDASISNWRGTIRYRSPVMAAAEAKSWVDEAETLYTDTVASMILDGVIS